MIDNKLPTIDFSKYFISKEKLDKILKMTDEKTPNYLHEFMEEISFREHLKRNRYYE